MHAVCAASQRDIGAIVHQDFRSMRIGKLEHAPDETRQFSRGQIFFTDLNTLYARCELPRDIRDEGFHATQRIAVGDVITQHYSGV
jgi:hypothetical protein